MYRFPKSKWPACLRNHKQLKGVYVGGCINGINWDQTKYGGVFTRNVIPLAHAHTSRIINPGWMCLQHENYLQEPYLLIHELAHILSDQGHNDRWRKKVLELGGTLDAVGSIRDYHKISRNVSKTPILSFRTFRNMNSLWF